MEGKPWVPITVALIGFAGVIGAAVIANWSEIFGPAASSGTGGASRTESAAPPPESRTSRTGTTAGLAPSTLAGWWQGLSGPYRGTAMQIVHDGPVFATFFCAGGRGIGCVDIDARLLSARGPRAEVSFIEGSFGQRVTATLAVSGARLEVTHHAGPTPGLHIFERMR